MHDIKAIRETPEAYARGWSRRGLDGVAIVEELLALDRAERAAKTAKQEAEAGRNAASKAIGAAKAKKDEAEAVRLMGEVERLKGVIEAEGAKEAEAGRALFDRLAGLLNVPAEDVPEGADEHGNVEKRRWGAVRSIAAPKDHVTLGEPLGMDFESAVRISGARFVALKGDLARLERALAAFMLDLHTTSFGYTEVSPPLLVNRQTAFGTGQLPKFDLDLFSTLPEDYFEKRDTLAKYINDSRNRIGDLRDFMQNNLLASLEVGQAVQNAIENNYQVISDASALLVDFDGDRSVLIPTAEVSLTNLVREQILDEAELPIRMTADTPCFRSEAGSAGRDTRGMIRMHQFRKVELVTIAHPDQSNEEHERMTEAAETVLKRLELPFRTMLLCSGDMGFSARKTYDLEVWLPSQEKYREISSCSNCGDFQARRMNARFRRPAADGKGKGTNEFVHTLNGSGLAVGRTLVAILENYQEADGSVSLPSALHPYMGGKTRLEPAR